MIDDIDAYTVRLTHNQLTYTLLNSKPLHGTTLRKCKQKEVSEKNHTEQQKCHFTLKSALINSIPMNQMGDKSIETYSDQLSVTLRTNKLQVTINLTATVGGSTINLFQ